MGNFARNLARGKVEERKVAAYLKSLRYRVLPTTEFSASGAPMLDAEDPSESLVMPDLQAFRDGDGSWFEVKWKSHAEPYRRYGNRLETGISLRHYNHYCAIENEWSTPVVLVFVHEKEGEVRCATLHQLEDAFSHDDRGSKMEASGMRFWIYERIPLWMPLAELGAAITAHRMGGRLIAPAIEPPIDNRLLRRRTHISARHGAPTGTESSGVFSTRERPRRCAGWTSTCLQCNETWIGDISQHTCISPLSYARDFWARKLEFVLPGSSAEERLKILAKPIARSQMISWFGPQWSTDGDPK